jgi:group I intron endonuclease
MSWFNFFRRTWKGGLSVSRSQQHLPQKPAFVVPICGYVYSAVCRINKKGYVGQTTQTPEERWQRHRQDAKAKKQTNGFTKRFHFALHEHGENNFEFRVIDTASSHEELNQKERHWIAHYKYDNPEYGYNSTSGGAGQKEQFRAAQEVGRQAHHEAKARQASEEKLALEQLAAKKRLEREDELRKDWEHGGNVHKTEPPMPTVIDDVGNMLVQQLPPEDYEGSELQWRKTSRGNYTLSLYVFRSDGSFITSNGSVSIFGCGRVNNNVDYFEKYHVNATIGDQTFEGFYPTFALAIKAADKLVETKAPDDYKRVRRDYEPPADEQQTGYLRTLYGDREFPADLTHKEAQQLIREHRWTSPSIDKQKQKSEDDAVIAKIVRAT